MRAAIYIAALGILNLLMAFEPWGSVYLSLIIAMTYIAFRPLRVLHPNNMIFAFYGLYVILSSTLDLTLHLIDWDYVLPWGQQIFWNTFSRYVLFQAEFTFLILYFSFHFFARERRVSNIDPRPVVISASMLRGLYIFTFILVLWFIEATAGLDAWINDYSFTYLTKREGHGFLNVVTIAFGNIVVFLLGLRTFYAHDKFKLIVAALAVILALSYINGVKSRFIFLLIMYLSPYFMTMAFRAKYLVGFTAAFFVLLYLGTLVRTEGYYASAPFFLEMLVGYFNAFQLHDYIVTSRDPAFLQTVFQIFTKPMQFLGLLDANANFDISVMLTKEFFPEQWDNEKATQQWPLDTELYLNYYGFYLSWLPLICYAAFVSWLYRLAILRRSFALVPIFIMEFQRIFSTMRGTIVPWEVFIYIGQYAVIYVVCKMSISRLPRDASVRHANHQFV